MSRIQQVLAGVAAVQLALLGYTWRAQAESAGEPHELVTLPGEVDRVVIHGRRRPGEEPTTVELKKQGTRWVLPALNDYPADTEAVTEVIDKLTGLQVRRPTATQATSHTSLNVAEGDHARTVELHAGDASATLVLGAASGTSTHVRRADEAETYTVRGWTSFSIGELPRRYWQPDALSLDPATVDSLTVLQGDRGFTLKRGPDGWGAAGDDRPLDQAAVDGHLTRLANLKITDVLTTDPPDLAEGTQVSWTATVGQETVEGGLRIGTVDGGNTPIKLDGGRWTVKVQATAIDPWKTLTLEDLLADEPAGEPPTE